MKRVSLNRREKIVVAGAAVFLTVFLLFQLLISPLLHRKERLSLVISSKLSALEEIQALEIEYRSLQGRSDLAKASLDRRSKDFSLFSFLDGLNGEVDIRGNVPNMKPSTSLQKDTNLKVSTVELKLQAVTLEQLVQYLYKIEYSGNNLSVRRMTISETENQAGYIDVQLQVETVAL